MIDWIFCPAWIFSDSSLSVSERVPVEPAIKRKEAVVRTVTETTDGAEGAENQKALAPLSDSSSNSSSSSSDSDMDSSDDYSQSKSLIDY